MAITHRGTTPRSPSPAAGADQSLDSPPALRNRLSRWRDPRLWIGVLLVAGSVLVGARVMAASNDTVTVWQATHDAGAGNPLSERDVRVAHVHFASSSDAAAYVSAADPLPAQARLVDDLETGEFLPTSAMSTDSAPPQRELPLGVESAGFPANLSSGDHVEVWAVPSTDDRSATPRLVLGDVPVASLGEAGPGGLGSQRQVVVALPAATDVGRALGALSGRSVVLVRIGG